MVNVSKFAVLARTLPKLGFGNIARVAAYRAALKFPSRIKGISAHTPKGPFFSAPEIVKDGPKPAALWREEGKLFSFHPFSISNAPPDWHANPLTGARVKNADKPWHAIPDFDPEVGDIKLIWELSRFSWLPAFAQRAKRGQDGALGRLNVWLDDWAQNNPPYMGPNWKCGQEASLRVMHLIVASEILGSATPAFKDLIKVHLKRIAPTVSYAMAQDNNHGTSEAAALFIGGHYTADKEYQALGRKLLENRASRLIGDDGSFAQYSVNYHRLMLDALSLAQWWRAKQNLAPFSDTLNTKMRAASDWLYRLTEPSSGDAPNIGANDGAQILQLTDALYRDFRPSTALAQALWNGTRAYPDCSVSQDHLVWMGIEINPPKAPDCSLTAAGEDGGFAVIRSGQTRAVLRHPRFKFRPSQCDALHVDVWHKDKNILRDAGTYSYNTAPEVMAYFGGASGHNSVQFMPEEQMPRIGRFLLGDWLTTEHFTFSPTSAAAAYRNRRGHVHQRALTLTRSALTVTDDISSASGGCVLRWRLIPGDYKLEIIDAAAAKLASPSFVLNISADIPISSALIEGEESRHYLEKTPLPVLEITAQLAGRITTTIEFTS